jgi:hypothetical protein
MTDADFRGLFVRLDRQFDPRPEFVEQLFADIDNAAAAPPETAPGGEGSGAHVAADLSGTLPEPAYIPEAETHPTLTVRGPRARRSRIIVALAVAALIATAVVVVTQSRTSHQQEISPTPSLLPATTAPSPTTEAAPPTTTAAPPTDEASRVAQMLAAGQFSAIASEIEPPSRRSADETVLEHAWGDLTAAYGSFVSTGTQDQGVLDALPQPPDTPAGAALDAADERVLQMSHGLILLRVTAGPDGALLHLEFRPEVYLGRYIGF